MPKINSLEVVHQDTNKDSYENLHDIIVSLKGARNQEMVDGEARALYETLLEMYVNDKEAFARRIERLQAKFGNSLAQVVEEMLAYASASEAYAKRITAVSAEVDTAKSSIMSESYARVTEDEALASQINTVSATLGTKTTTYVQTTAPTGSLAIPLVDGDLWFDSDDGYKLYRYNGSTWVAVDDSRIAANTAAISTETSTRVTADSALGIQINSVVARLDTGDFATVKEQAEAGATKNKSYSQSSAPTTGLIIGDLWFDTANGNKAYRWTGSSWVETTDTRLTNTYARWGVQVDANGNVAGIQLNSSSSGTSEFTVVANNFKVWGSGGQESTQKPLDVAVSGSTQTTYLGNALITYYEGTNINRWAAISNIKSSGIYSRPTATDLTTLPYSWASNGSAGFFAGNAGTGGNYHGLRGGVFNNNSDASTLSRGIVGSHTGAAFYAEIGSYAPFTGEHQSVVNKGYEIQEGQIVVDKEIVMKKDISNTLSRVEKSNTPNQRGVIGVFTRNIGPMSKVDTLSVIAEHRVDDGFGNLTGPLTEQYDQIKDLYDVVSINALGEGQILVCGENGNISTGDLIVTSSVEGVGMKQADDIIRSYTVAKAREDITFDDTTSSKLVPCIYLCG